MEVLIEATVGLAGAASSVALYRGVKRHLTPSQEEKDLRALDGSMAGRTVLVTGANSGVGLAAAELLARKVSGLSREREGGGDGGGGGGQVWWTHCEEEEVGGEGEDVPARAGAAGTKGREENDGRAHKS